MTTPDLCAYCIKAPLTGHEKPEHPIPAALGSSFWVRTVCDRCNEWAGKEIDKPFLGDALVREMQSLVDQRDPRRHPSRRVPSSILSGYTHDGDYLKHDHETGEVAFAPRIVDLGDGRRQLRGSTQADIDRLLERERGRVEPGFEVRVDGPVTTRRYRPTLHIDWTINPRAWRREAAKVGLAVGSYTFPPNWRLSPDAERLREWMHNRDPRTQDSQAPGLAPVPFPATALVRDSEHLMYFVRGSDGWIYLHVVLFGAHVFAVPVHSDPSVALPNQAWRLDWRRPRSNGETTVGALILDALTRTAAA